MRGVTARAPSQRLAGRVGAARRPFAAESGEESDEAAAEAGRRRRGAAQQQPQEQQQQQQPPQQRRQHEQGEELLEQQQQVEQKQQHRQGRQEQQHGEQQRGEQRQVAPRGGPDSSSLGEQRQVVRRGNPDSSALGEEQGSGLVGGARAARAPGSAHAATCAALLRLVQSGSDLNGVLTSETQRRDLCSFLVQGPSCTVKEVRCRAMLSLDLLCSSRRPSAGKSDAGALIDAMWGDIKTLFNSLIHQGPFAEPESEWLLGEATQVEPDAMAGRSFGPYGTHLFFVGLAYRFNLLFPARCYISVRDHVRSRLKRLRAGVPAPNSGADSDGVDTDGPGSGGAYVQRGKNKRTSDAANLSPPPAFLSPPPQPHYPQPQQPHYPHQQYYAQQRAQLPARRPYKLAKRSSAHDLQGELLEPALSRPQRAPTLRSSGKLRVLPLFRDLPGARRAFAAPISLCRDRDLELAKLLRAAHLRQAQR
jgi:hypothetical protein